MPVLQACSPALAPGVRPRRQESGGKGGGAETGGSQGSAHPTCVGAAGPKFWVLKVFVEEGG